MRALHVVWAAPYSLIGLLLGLTFSTRRLTRGVLLCEGATWPRKLGWHYRAITFGHVVLVVDRVDEGVMDHELVHVRQYETWGPLFVPAYLGAALVALVRRRHPYRDNPFEIAARGRVTEEPEATR